MGMVMNSNRRGCATTLAAIRTARNKSAHHRAPEARNREEWRDAFLIPRHHRQSLTLRVVVFNPGGPRDRMPQLAAILLLRDPEIPRTEEVVLQSLFSLTASEASF